MRLNSAARQAPPHGTFGGIHVQDLFPIAPHEIERVSIETVKSIAPRLDALAREVMAFWLPRSVDAEHGGFHGFLDREGNPAYPADKGAIQQARHLFALATWYERRETDSPVAEAAGSTFRLLVDRFRDPADDRYVFSIRRTGEVRDAAKILYAQGFVIFGLSHYGRVFHEPEALERALACFRAIDGRAHDALHGGYDEADDPAWLTGGGRKDTNTHIHLMEAFAALYEATGDRTARDRLEELVQLVSTRLRQPSGYMHQQFALDWTPIKTPSVSYGHDLETAWLLLEAERVLGERTPAVEQAAAAMGIHASAAGFDEKRGGYFDHGIPGGPVVGFEKVWWAQFEALAGLWWLFRLTGDTIHLERLLATLDWIEGPARDADHGEWYWGVMPDGALGPRGDHKGELWKTPYHNLRALVYTEDWIAKWMAAATRRQKRRFS